MNTCCMYIYIYNKIYTYIYVYLNLYKYYIHIYACLYAYIYIHIFIHLYIYSTYTSVSYTYIYIYDVCQWILYIYIYIHSLVQVLWSSFAFNLADKQVFFGELALPPYSRIQLHVRRSKYTTRKWFAWQVWRLKPSKFSKTFTFAGFQDGGRCLCQLKCALKWLRDQHFDHKNVFGLKLRSDHFVVSLYLYIYIQILNDFLFTVSSKNSFLSLYIIYTFVPMHI